MAAAVFLTKTTPPSTENNFDFRENNYFLISDEDWLRGYESMGQKPPVRNVLGRQSGGHLHTFFTLFTPYALRMQPYAPIMHFLPASRKPIKSRPERTSKKPYALYAPLLGVGPFFAFFLLREVHTVHKTAYAIGFNQALALLPVGIEASTARETSKCIRKCIRIFAENRHLRNCFVFARHQS